jgi:hypothetical protein
MVAFSFFGGWLKLLVKTHESGTEAVSDGGDRGAGTAAGGGLFLGKAVPEVDDSGGHLFQGHGCGAKAHGNQLFDFAAIGEGIDRDDGVGGGTGGDSIDGSGGGAHDF